MLHELTACPGEAPGRPPPNEEGWQTRAGLTLADAEELLDMLDNHGNPQREVVILPSGVTVRWQATA